MSDSLVWQTWRIKQIFNQRQFRKVTISDRQLLFNRVLPLVAMMLLYLVIWNGAQVCVRANSLSPSDLRLSALCRRVACQAFARIAASRCFTFTQAHNDCGLLVCLLLLSACMLQAPLPQLSRSSRVRSVLAVQDDALTAAIEVSLSVLAVSAELSWFQ